MTILNIITAPDPILRIKSSPIASVNNDIRKLMSDMLETMYDDNGVGLAAVQVGVLKRILVVDLETEDKDSSVNYPIFMANPQIIQRSDTLVKAFEGCLSVPEQRIEVARSENITVKFLDYNNNTQELYASNWLARVIQHEMDHLDGKLLIDYLTSIKKDVAIRKLNKLKKQKSLEKE